MNGLLPYTDLLSHPHSGVVSILGAGPTLQLDFLSDPNKDLINNHTVISVNSSIMAVDWSKEGVNPRYWISNDSLCMKWSYWKLVKESLAVKIIRNSWEKHVHKLAGFYYFWPRPTKEGVVNAEDNGLAYCSSVPSSIDFAIQAGYKKIFLFGVDHFAHHGKTHFWQLGEKDRMPTNWQMYLSPYSCQKNVFDNYNMMAFDALSKFAKSKGVEIFNCSLSSRVEIFEKMLASEALESMR